PRPARPGNHLPQGDGQVARPPLLIRTRTCRRLAPLPPRRTDTRPAGWPLRAPGPLVPPQPGRRRLAPRRVTELGVRLVATVAALRGPRAKKRLGKRRPTIGNAQ